MSEYRYNPDGSINRARSQVLSDSRPSGSSQQSSSTGKRSSMGGNMDRRADVKIAKVELPWHYESDKRFFANGEKEHQIQRYSPEYYEFQEFYKRLLLHKSKSGLSSSEMPASHGSLASLFGTSDTRTGNHKKFSSDLEAEAKLINEALELFKEFLRQKRTDQTSNISKDRMKLPIFSFRQHILDTIRNNQVTIIAAETGAGKSTQVPQYLLEDGYQRIACTQPRRIACLSLAKRVGQERIGWPGASSQDIGYQIRFEKSFNSQINKDSPNVLFLTEGILLRQISSDILLNQYDLIIIDEVHERHAMVDFLLGLLKQVLKIRPALKLVLMSATIQSELFSSYFNNAPLITVPGKTFPVDIEYTPILGPKGKIELDLNLVDPAYMKERLDQQKELGFSSSIRAPSAKFDAKPYVDILKLIDSQYPSNEGGHLLVFMSGSQEIQQLYDGLEEYVKESKCWILLKLHSALSMKQQDKVFRPTLPGIRKCILSTNIAETSVTLPEIRFIIDSGRVKELEWDPAAKLQRLSEVWISQASARQRSGRAGRTGPGRCWRLYSEEEFTALNDYSTAEILRGLSLDQIILQLKAIAFSDLGNEYSIELDPLKFEFVQTPAKHHMEESLRFLRQVGALDSSASITLLGNKLSLLPLDVILGKILLVGNAFNVKNWAMLITSSLSVASPFLREDPQTSRQQILQEFASEFAGVSRDTHDWKKEKEKFEVVQGDPFALVSVLQNWIQIHHDDRISSRKWCSKLSIEEQRLYEVVKLISQFKQFLRTGRQSTDRLRSQKVAFDAWQRQKAVEKDEEAKMLSLDNQDDEEFNDDEPDMLLLEFRARHQVDSLYNEFAKYSFKELDLVEKVLLQLILCSGLYPNIALADPANGSRRPADRVFHTKYKRFVLLHPSSVFSKRPEWVPQIKSSINHSHEMSGMATEKVNLQMRMAEEGDLDIVDFEDVKSRFDDRPTQSTNLNSPSLLCFVQIMETSKPYLMNVFPVPALLSTFLFGIIIDTNKDLSYVVIDEWLLIEFKSLNRLTGKSDNTVIRVVAELIRKLVRFREEWNCRVDNDLLNGSFSSKIPIKRSRIPGNITLDTRKYMSKEVETMYEGILKDTKTTQGRSERPHQDFLAHLDLILDIDKYLHENGVYYEIDILKEADVSKLFPQNIENVSLDSMRVPEKSNEQQKFGIQILEYLNYGTVQYPFSLFKKPIRDSSLPEPQSPLGSMRSVKKVWQCSFCKKAMMLTDVDIQIHQFECKGVDLPASDTNVEEKKPVSAASIPSTSNTVRSDGTCPKCGIKLPATPIEKLRHRKICGKY